MPTSQLTKEERLSITYLHMAGYSAAKIGRRLKRHRGTITREIQRNSDRMCGYHYESAQRQAD